MCIALMIFAYPVYYHAFTLVPVGGLSFLCLFPLMKFVVRQLFHRFARKTHGAEELVPQVVVFNADAMSALFVAICMQFKPSLGISLAVAGFKLVQAFLLYRDIQTAGRRLCALRDRLKDYRSSMRRTIIQVTTLHKAALPKMSVLDEVAEIIGRYGLDERTVTATRQEVIPLSNWSKLAGCCVSRVN